MGLSGNGFLSTVYQVILEISPEYIVCSSHFPTAPYFWYSAVYKSQDNHSHQGCQQKADDHIQLPHSQGYPVIHPLF